MASNPDLRGVFDLEFSEQIEFFRKKIDLPPCVGTTFVARRMTPHLSSPGR
jgi:hypothetical protein